MPASKKSPGYAITIRAFLPAPLGDMVKYQEVSAAVEKARATLGPGAKAEIQTDRRAVEP